MFSEKKIYETIPGVKNMVTVLVDNIYNDEIYQKYLKKLEKSDGDEQKKADIIKRTFTSIKVFNTAKEPLFLARDIGILMGIPHIKAIVKRYDENEKAVGYIKTTEGKIKEMVFLTKYGIYRTFLTSRSKLSKVFRNFIYKLIDHMATHESEKLNKIIIEFQKENPEMIKESIQELNENYIKFKHLYEQEMYDRIIWQSKAEKEHAEKELLERHRDELDSLISFNEIYTYEITKKNEEYFFMLRDLKAQNQARDFDNNYYEEILTLKRKYMKEVQIYLVKADHIDKIDKSNNTLNPEFIDAYKKIYSKNVSKSGEVLVEYNEVLLYKISFGKKITKNKFTHIETEWIPDRASYNKLIDVLKTETEWSSVKDQQGEPIFKTTLENIKLNIRNLIE